MRTIVNLRGNRMPNRDAVKLKTLRAHIKAGVDALEKGDFIEVEAEDLADYLKRISAASDADEPT